MTSRKSLSGTDGRARPKPCKQYAKMILNPKFLAHLPDCRACKSVVVNLSRESELNRFFSFEQVECKCNNG